VAAAEKAPSTLTQEQIEQFWRDGCVTAENGVTLAQLAALRRELALWVEASRAETKPFGTPTIDGRPRFDMGAEHTAERPALRRVNNPSDISPVYREVMENAAIVDMVSDLIGPDVKFHHCKINVKLPGSNTEVGYHQDFPYTPHTNDDIVTALLMLDDMTPENGCLTVVPGSHRGPLYSLFEKDVFVGSIDARVTAKLKPQELQISGKAGSVCLMHTRLVHGSDANRSTQNRGLYICVYSAADAFPLAANPLPNPNEGKVVRGHKSRQARLMDAVIELPAQAKVASFFATQGQRSAGG
jgi:ectoine hydroxylase-related dioxygenase (phytanoyl-CoA dioxygenase family)